MSDHRRYRVGKGIYYRILIDGSRAYTVWHGGSWRAAGTTEEEAVAKKELLKKIDPRIPKALKKKRGDGGVYFVQGVDGGPIKIGWTSRAIKERLQGLQTGSPLTLRVVTWLPGQTKELEQELHRRLGYWRLHGEWFEPCRELHELRLLCESGLSLPG